MENVLKLKDKYTGKIGLIIGGGCSVNEFDFSSVPEEVIRINVNWSFIDTRIDYTIYADNFFRGEVIKGNYKVPEASKVIGYEKFIYSGTDYFFNFNDVVIGFHSGYYALQIAQIMGFDSIYLIGFDYKENDGKLHYYEGNFQKSQY